MKVKLTDWNIQDYLKTPEDRALYLEAAIEEADRNGDMDLLAAAFGDVAQSAGGGKVAEFMAGISTGIKAMLSNMPQTARRKPARREAATA